MALRRITTDCAIGLTFASDDSNGRSSKIDDFSASSEEDDLSSLSKFYYIWTCSHDH